jgi:hypothetical protein
LTNFIGDGCTLLAGMLERLAVGSDNRGCTMASFIKTG